MTSKTLEGLRALVTGGGSGIGRETCLALARAGAEVAIVDIDVQGSEATCTSIVEQGGKAFLLQGSVSDSRDVARAFGELDARWDRLDILVNNAGVSGNKSTLEMSDDDWRRTISINQDGVFYCCREAGRRMLKQQGGSIVNLGSIYSIVAAPNRLSYCASKAAVAMMTKCLAIEWAEHGIRVNGVAPGYVKTALLEELARSGRIDMAALERRTPQKRLALPEEIADAVLYLCEPRTNHITGQMLAVDGGWSAYGYI
jgi:NAD(P)-dependent dehydrogenase (short-subunit alcohol dehydrogenase family)